MKLEEWRKKDVQESLELLDTTANEATRTHIVIGVLLTHICKQDRSYSYIAQNSKDGHITDFEVFKTKLLLHIIETKISLGHAEGLKQLKEYLKSRKCERGCVTEGFIWQFYRVNNNGDLEKDGNPLYTKYDLDQIVDKITILD